MKEKSSQMYNWNFNSNQNETDNTQKNDNEPDATKETYRIVDLDRMEETMNMMASCNCQKDAEVDNFINFCLESECGLDKDKFQELVKNWKRKNERNKQNQRKASQNKIKIRNEQIGICTKTYLCCENCNKTMQVKPKQSTRFMGKGYNGGFNNHDKSLFYEQNIKLVLGTIAAGIGPKDVETVFSFLGIPMPSSFPYVTFPRIENAIGDTLINVSEASMEDALKQEVEVETGKTFS